MRRARYFRAHPAVELVVGQALQIDEQRLEPRDVAGSSLAAGGRRIYERFEGAREVPLPYALVEHHRNNRRQTLGFRTLFFEHVAPHREQVA